MSDLHLKNVSKTFAGSVTPAVSDVDLEIAEGEFVVLVGPSGCGKSTTLRMVAGLEEVSSGAVLIGGKPVNDLEPSARNIAMVFQNYALYPHLSVAQNIGFGLRRARLSRAEKQVRIREIATLLEINALLHRKPGALSGGQRQRVAMGRALIRDPSVFLFDEPLSNLDAKLRVQMRIEIKRLHQRMPVTTLYVTHDQTEAMTMADRVVVMNRGRIEQAAPPLEIYAAPKTRFVAEFIGAPAMNIFAGRVADDGSHVMLDSGSVAIPPDQRPRFAQLASRQIDLGIRPEDIHFAPNGPMVDLTLLEPLGAETLAYFMLGHTQGCARLNPQTAPPAGDRHTIGIDLEKVVFFNPATERAIPTHHH